MNCILNISCDYSPENLLLKSNNFPLLTIFSFLLIMLMSRRTVVCCVIEVPFESALFSWVDKLAHSAWDSLSTQEYKRVLMNSRLWLPAKFVE